jgi:hypothetical protein
MIWGLIGLSSEYGKKGPQKINIAGIRNIKRS